MRKLILLLVTVLLCSCQYKNPAPQIISKKVVSAKTIEKSHKTIRHSYIVAFTDGSDTRVSFGLYTLAEVGDTMVFITKKGLAFNTWNSNFVKVVECYK